jgi:hypothetical protein
LFIHSSAHGTAIRQLPEWKAGCLPKGDLAGTNVAEAGILPAKDRGKGVKRQLWSAGKNLPRSWPLEAGMGRRGAVAATKSSRAAHDGIGTAEVPRLILLTRIQSPGLDNMKKTKA